MGTEAASPKSNKKPWSDSAVAKTPIPPRMGTEAASPKSNKKPWSDSRVGKKLKSLKVRRHSPVKSWTNSPMSSKRKKMIRQLTTKNKAAIEAVQDDDMHGEEAQLIYMRAMLNNGRRTHINAPPLIILETLGRREGTVIFLLIFVVPIVALFTGFGTLFGKGIFQSNRIECLVHSSVSIVMNVLFIGVVVCYFVISLKRLKFREWLPEQQYLGGIMVLQAVFGRHTWQSIYWLAYAGCTDTYRYCSAYLIDCERFGSNSSASNISQAKGGVEVLRVIHDIKFAAELFMWTVLLYLWFYCFRMVRGQRPVCLIRKPLLLTEIV